MFLTWTRSSSFYFFFIVSPSTLTGGPDGNSHPDFVFMDEETDSWRGKGARPRRCREEMGQMGERLCGSGFRAHTTFCGASSTFPWKRRPGSGNVCGGDSLASWLYAGDSGFSFDNVVLFAFYFIIKLFEY